MQLSSISDRVRRLIDRPSPVRLVIRPETTVMSAFDDLCQDELLGRIDDVREEILALEERLAELDGELIRLILALGDPSELLVEE